MNIQRQEQIEAYLQGTLPAEEKAHFEKLLQRDHVLRDEVEMHRLMVEAICAERKASLKRLLDNTPVPHGPTFSWSAGQWWRWGVGVVALGSVIWLAIWSNHKKEEWPVQSPAPTTSVTEQTAPSIESNEAPVTEGLKPEEEREKTDVPLQATQEPPIEKVQPSVQHQQKEEKSMESRLTPQKEETQIITEPVEQPLPREVSEEEEALRDFEQSLFYQYNNKVLVLFKEVDYQLLQGIDLGNGAKDYIFVNNHFYEIKETGDSIENFENCRVTDSTKVQMLKKYLTP
ncbi:hypothetical protein [Thermonema rossianum]|uniref:hypothetical protein n=1 Tax=Thermonema rossianum TaxID=55505 RepID=UPI00056E2E64|nr:hypothetical protein [Thermonema rossianum]